MKPFLNYLSASRAELAKVTWPNRKQTVRLTTAVIIFSLIMAGVLGILDMLFSNFVQLLIG